MSVLTRLASGLPHARELLWQGWGMTRSRLPGARTAARRALAGHTKLNLGCGPHILPGWANIDAAPRSGGAIAWDLRRSLPVAPGSLRFAYAEHFIEHITRAQALTLLRDVRRFLSPSGVLRPSTPDLRFLVAEYLEGRTNEWANMQWHPATPCQMVNEGMRLWGHQSVFDRAELHGTLREAGFDAVADCEWGESAHAELRGRETRPWHHELIVEATLF